MYFIKINADLAQIALSALIPLLGLVGIGFGAGGVTGGGAGTGAGAGAGTGAGAGAGAGDTTASGATLTPFGGGKAQGGPTFSDKFYQVVEDKRPELLEEGGRTYLIPGQNGFVTPLTPLPSTSPSASLRGVPFAPPATAPVTNFSVIVTQGDISIGDVGENIDQQSLTSDIAGILRGESTRTIDSLNATAMMRDRQR